MLAPCDLQAQLCDALLVAHARRFRAGLRREGGAQLGRRCRGTLESRDAVLGQAQGRNIFSTRFKYTRYIPCPGLSLYTQLTAMTALTLYLPYPALAVRGSACVCHQSAMCEHLHTAVSTSRSPRVCCVCGVSPEAPGGALQKILMRRPPPGGARGRRTSRERRCCTVGQRSTSQSLCDTLDLGTKRNGFVAPYI